MIDISGVVWVDSDDFLVRRLDLEYVDGVRALAGISWSYEDVAVGDGVFRLITRGELRAASLGVRSDATITFEQIRRVVP